MSSEQDVFGEIFGEIDKFYPGSKKLRRTKVEREVKREPKQVDPTGWDERPYLKNIRGKQVETFTVGALARALGKSEITIRLWTKKGYIPEAPYRLPPTIVGGTSRPGRRLYTREMVEAAIAAFAKRGLIDSPRIEWSEHSGLSLEILEAWKDIQAQMASND